MKKVDYIVIGAGAAGLTVAFTAKGFGKKVLVIDKNKPGGECTWSGCIPSKVLINQANDIFTARKYADFDIDTKLVMDGVAKVIASVYEEESVDVLEKEGISFLRGEATFLEPHVLQVNGESIRGNKIFICTGSSPMIPPIDGLLEVDYLTNETFFELEGLPKEMIVLGGGAIGVELSQAMNRLGVEVHLVEMAPSILPREDQELSQQLRQRLEEEGLHIYTSHKAVKAEEKDGRVTLHLENSKGTCQVSADRILLALGRVPRVKHMGLDKAGLKYGPGGLMVNDYLETTVKGVYAIGDVVGPYRFSHMANVQGIQAVQNAVLPFKRKVNYEHVAWCTFSSPELASAGLSEEEARKKYGDSIRVYRHDYNQLDRAKTKEGSIGRVKLIVDKRGKVLGASILGDRAGELISEVQVLKTLGINYGKLSKVIHPYPTYSEILNKISKRVVVDNLLNLPLVKLFKK